MTALFLFAFLSSLEKLDIFSYVLAFAILTEINYSYPVFTFVIESDSKFISNAFSCLLLLFHCADVLETLISSQENFGRVITQVP